MNFELVPRPVADTHKSCNSGLHTISLHGRSGQVLYVQLSPSGEVITLSVTPAVLATATNKLSSSTQITSLQNLSGEGVVTAVHVFPSVDLLTLFKDPVL